MNASSACPQCGTIASPTDKFCNTCGTRLPAAPAQGAPVPQAAPQGYGAPPPQGGYGPPPPQQGAPPAGPQYAQTPYPAQIPAQPQAQYGMPSGRASRCQLGHDIAPGASYCAQGHPIALDAMQFAPPPQQPAPPVGGFGAPQPPPQPAGGYGFGPPAPGFGAPPPQPMQPPMQQPPFGAPPPQQAPQGYGPPQPMFQPAAVPPPGAPPQYGGAPGPSPAAYSDHTAPDRVPAGAKVLRGFLASFQANAQGEFWPFYTGRTTIGRANAGEPADVPLADATISSRHASLVIDSDRVIVEDTNSTNGTYVNEEPIGQNGKRELRDGDRLRFGGFTTIVKILGRV